MASISSTGQSSTQNYYIGRGCVFLAELKDGRPTTWREVGNVADLTIEADSSTIEHFSSKGFTRVKDSEVLGEVSYNFSLTMDEFMYENLATFFLGTADKYTNGSLSAGLVGDDFNEWSAGTGSRFTVPNQNTSNSDPLDDDQIGGRYYDLHVIEESGTGTHSLVIGGGPAGLTQETRVYDMDMSGVTILGNAVGSGWTYEPGEGQIFIEKGGALETAIIAAQGSTTASRYFSQAVVIPSGSTTLARAIELDQMSANTKDQATVAVKFIALNGNVAGEKHEMVIHQAKLRPQGSLGVIQEDDFGQIVLEGSMEQNGVADPSGGGFYTVRKIG